MSDRLVSLRVSGGFIQIMASKARARSKTQMFRISHIFSPTFINQTFRFSPKVKCENLDFKNLRFLGTL